MLWVILAAAILLWTLIVERLLFYRWVFPRRTHTWIEQWRQRRDHMSWHAQAIRELMISEARGQLDAGLPMIKTLIALCPMLGLLGTVTGMVTVFDALSMTGTSDAHAISAGVSRATITTMAGLLIALSGYYFAIRFRRRVRRESHALADRLDIHARRGGNA